MDDDEDDGERRSEVGSVSIRNMRAKPKMSERAIEREGFMGLGDVEECTPCPRSDSLP